MFVTLRRAAASFFTVPKAAPRVRAKLGIEVLEGRVMPATQVWEITSLSGVQSLPYP